MLFAKNIKSGLIVWAIQTDLDEETLFCSECNVTVFLKTGPIKVRHFAHMTDEKDCTLRKGAKVDMEKFRPEDLVHLAWLIVHNLIKEKGTLECVIPCERCLITSITKISDFTSREVHKEGSCIIISDETSSPSFDAKSFIHFEDLWRTEINVRAYAVSSCDRVKCMDNVQLAKLLQVYIPLPWHEQCYWQLYGKIDSSDLELKNNWYEFCKRNRCFMCGKNDEDSKFDQNTLYCYRCYELVKQDQLKMISMIASSTVNELAQGIGYIVQRPKLSLKEEPEEYIKALIKLEYTDLEFFKVPRTVTNLNTKIIEYIKVELENRHVCIICNEQNLVYHTVLKNQSHLYLEFKKLVEAYAQKNSFSVGDDDEKELKLKNLLEDIREDYDGQYCLVCRDYHWIEYQLAFKTKDGRVFITCINGELLPHGKIECTEQASRFATQRDVNWPYCVHCVDDFPIVPKIITRKRKLEPKDRDVPFKTCIKLLKELPSESTPFCCDCSKTKFDPVKVAQIARSVCWSCFAIRLKQE